MKKVEFNEALSLKLSKEQRAIIEGLATRQETSLGTATRFILEKGIMALGLRS
jgi:hypothetical protein